MNNSPCHLLTSVLDFRKFRIYNSKEEFNIFFSPIHIMWNIKCYTYIKIFLYLLPEKET